MSWSDAVASIDGTTFTQPSTNVWTEPVLGTTVDYERMMGSHAVHWILDNPQSVNVELILQGSLDGTNFYNMSVTSLLYSSSGPSITSANFLTVTNDSPARYVRAAVSTNGPGANSLTATALIAAEEA